MSIPWDLAAASAVYSFIATAWRQEAQRPDGIRVSWFVAGCMSLGSIALILFIAFRVSWVAAIICVAASLAGQILLIPFDRALRTVIGMWAGVIILLFTGAYMVDRLFHARTA
jgi:hypothetical protein